MWVLGAMGSVRCTDVGEPSLRLWVIGVTVPGFWLYDTLLLSLPLSLSLEAETAPWAFCPGLPVRGLNPRGMSTVNIPNIHDE